MSEDYYESEEWAEERKAVLRDWNGCCEHCGGVTCSPHVHHVYGLNHQVYKVLCPECHADHHGDDEILDYQGSSPTCKKCGRTCNWKEVNGRYMLADDYGNLHICKHLKQEAIAISTSINEKMKKRQKGLF